MIFSQDNSGACFILFCIAFWSFVMLYRKFVQSNPELGEAAKAAASKKARGLIERMLK